MIDIFGVSDGIGKATKADDVVANKAALAKSATNQSYSDADDISRKTGTVKFVPGTREVFTRGRAIYRILKAIQPSRRRSGTIEAIRKVETKGHRRNGDKRNAGKAGAVKNQSLPNWYQKA